MWADKRGIGVNKGDNAAMRRGRLMEPAVAAALAETHPDWDVRKYTEYWRESELRIGCTPDYQLFNAERGLGLLRCRLEGLIVAA